MERLAAADNSHVVSSLADCDIVCKSVKHARQVDA
jgi:hypothetical protein